jgi:hypothetical protein
LSILQLSLGMAEVITPRSQLHKAHPGRLPHPRDLAAARDYLVKMRHKPPHFREGFLPPDDRSRLLLVG